MLEPKDGLQTGFLRGKEASVAHSIRANRDGADFVIEASGEIDAGAADDLSIALAEASEAEGSAMVLIELSGADLLDSRSIGVLADWQARIRVAGGRLGIVGARPEVRRLFTAIGLEETFEFFTSIAAAREPSGDQPPV